ncbi:hypothetical protein FMEAI12_3760035 [Parafrankia sp. Ea1.12]|nr:hypothetical protein FMEAI12_3760035 [Parafrankia sp. Ea1.12]
MTSPGRWKDLTDGAQWSESQVQPRTGGLSDNSRAVSSHKAVRCRGPSTVTTQTGNIQWTINVQRGDALLRPVRQWT